MNAGAAKIKGGISAIGDFLNIFSGPKLAAIILWLSSAYMTSRLIDSVSGSAVSTGGNLLGTIVSFFWGSSFFAAVVGQFILTVGEQSIWRGRGFNLVSGICLFLDTLINAASLWPFVKALGISEVWRFIQEVLRWAAPGMSVGYNIGVAAVLCLLFAVGFAYGPEKLWSQR